MRMEIELLRMGLPVGLGGNAPAQAEMGDSTALVNPVVIDPTPRRASPAAGVNALSLEAEEFAEEGDDELGDGLRTIFRLTSG